MNGIAETEVARWTAKGKGGVLFEIWLTHQVGRQVDCYATVLRVGGPGKVPTGRATRFSVAEAYEAVAGFKARLPVELEWMGGPEA